MALVREMVFPPRGLWTCGRIYLSLPRAPKREPRALVCKFEKYRASFLMPVFQSVSFLLPDQNNEVNNIVD